MLHLGQAKRLEHRRYVVAEPAAQPAEAPVPVAENSETAAETPDAEAEAETNEQLDESMKIHENLDNILNREEITQYPR